MITIDQLLESVDLDFEPRWVTKDEDGCIAIWDENKPVPDDDIWDTPDDCNYDYFGKLKLSEFDGKDWQECIYEVPRKTTGKIEKLPEFDRTEASIFHAERLYGVVNELVDAVNELKTRMELPRLNLVSTDEDFRKMMCDPKYWRDKDQEITQKIQNGINKLYGDKN